MHVYLENKTNPSIRFEVLTYDKATKVATVRGQYGAEFTRDISKEALEKYGYHIVKSEAPLPLMSKTPTKPPVPQKSEEE